MNKTQKKAFEAQVKKDRLGQYGPGSAWCNVHQCRPGTCFALHYPNAFKKGKKVRYSA